MSKRKDIFNEPFDDGTLAKLAIYEGYLNEWLPVFLAKQIPIWQNVQVFDFCAGRGQDVNGVPGSPLITLNSLNKWTGNIVNKGLKVRVVLNEPEQRYFTHLTKVVETVVKPKVYGTDVFSESFETLFVKEYNGMKGSANLIFIDQNGVKMLTKDVFAAIIGLKQTDFLFFISSSFFKRFGDSKEFQQYVKIDFSKITEKDYYHIHNEIFEYYKQLIPKHREYYLAPFSIKKGSNIYGLVYGTNHTLGIEKFLSVCWKMDEQRGTANFDIDRENISKEAPSLFPQFNVPTKIQLFEKDIENKLINKEIATNKSLYLYGLANGFLPKQVNKVLKELKAKKVIDYKFKPISGNVHRIPTPEPIVIQ
jgi:three-Cys-motif partner protein